MTYRSIVAAAGLALASTSIASQANADAVSYAIDPSHSQAIFSYNHLGMSTTYGMFSGWEGEILFDEDAPEASSVTVSIPTLAMFTGWEARDDHFNSGDFLGTSEDDMVTFTSTSIEVTGDNTAMITGDLTINGTTNEVTLETTMNFNGAHPSPNAGGAAALGFTGTTQILRSDFGAGAFAPFVSDEVEVTIEIEAMAAM
ncbi:MAG: YceI family protein [Pseudomonadota bacterium]